MSTPSTVAVIGCGLIGERRAEHAVAAENSRLALVVDANAERSRSLAKRTGSRASCDWQDAIDDPSIDVVVVSTPNGFLAEIAIAALDAGKHVLAEKPMGRNVSEATAMAAAATRAGKILKIGFNHRYHPAIAKAHALFSTGTVGNMINIRARYGHGGRPGYEREWRGDPTLAGGGELTDQGVHIADLIHWFAGIPSQAFGYTQTAIWPIAPLEDNAFGLFRFQNGAVASLHTTWTQWKNLFSFELFGSRGSICIDGLGKSYGVERLTVAQRRPEGGAPDITEEAFEGPDDSWSLEWHDFLSAVQRSTPYLGTPADGLAASRMIAALYESAQRNAPIALATEG